LQNRFTEVQFMTADSITVLQTVSVKKRFAKSFYEGAIYDRGQYNGFANRFGEKTICKIVLQ